MHSVNGTGKNLDFGQSGSQRIAQMLAKDCRNNRKGAMEVSAAKDKISRRTVITSNMSCLKKYVKHVPKFEMIPKMTWKA